MEAFILGVWAVWSADRDISAFTESLAFMIMVNIMRSFVLLALPKLDGRWAVETAVLWLTAMLVFRVVNRYPSTFVQTLIAAFAGSALYYLISMNIETFLYF
ncbi:MAG: diguanylate cyclase [Neisseria sp.]|nr:diguanylate cyclase [Neisseria sp.]